MCRIYLNINLAEHVDYLQIAELVFIIYYDYLVIGTSGSSTDYNKAIFVINFYLNLDIYQVELQKVYIFYVNYSVTYIVNYSYILLNW